MGTPTSPPKPWGSEPDCAPPSLLPSALLRLPRPLLELLPPMLPPLPWPPPPPTLPLLPPPHSKLRTSSSGGGSAAHGGGGICERVVSGRPNVLRYQVRPPAVASHLYASRRVTQSPTAGRLRAAPVAACRAAAECAAAAAAAAALAGQAEGRATVVRTARLGGAAGGAALGLAASGPHGLRRHPRCRCCLRRTANSESPHLGGAARRTEAGNWRA